MKKIKAKIDKHGLFFIDVNINNPVNNKVAMKATAIIDTGASSSHVKRELIEYLELSIIGISSFRNPIDRNIETNVFSIDLDIINLKLFKNINVRIIHDDLYPADFIIGTDILRLLHFSYNPKTTNFYISVDR
jgi:predicted aspartyl protease